MHYSFLLFVFRIRSTLLKCIPWCEGSRTSSLGGYGNDYLGFTQFRLRSDIDFWTVGAIRYICTDSCFKICRTSLEYICDNCTVTFPTRQG
ncbi:hypothetical protein KC19_3G139400 [Ceratodon purpureus]|uniref:Secreted protein n=1 Tax=Ceratodon purpureus TaxID=3225 RepID=A0A8T0IKT9_CERPU|nr:hypothetical protein KC19_3G139400 [Ceratodon purpureus]